MNQIFKRDKMPSLKLLFQTFNSGPSILVVPWGQKNSWGGDNGRKVTFKVAPYCI